jgi:hypothetical protein
MLEKKYFIANSKRLTPMASSATFSPFSIFPFSCRLNGQCGFFDSRDKPLGIQSPDSLKIIKITQFEQTQKGVEVQARGNFLRISNTGATGASAILHSPGEKRAIPTGHLGLDAKNASSHPMGYPTQPVSSKVTCCNVTKQR